MSLNKNLKTRRKQLAILAAVITGGAAATSGVIWYGQHQQEQKQPAPVATPNMTGVVTAAFNQQVNDAALAQQQAKTSALEDKLATLTQQFAQNKLTTEQQLAKKDEEIQRLNDQLTKAPANDHWPADTTCRSERNTTPRSRCCRSGPATRIHCDPRRHTGRHWCEYGAGRSVLPGRLWPENDRRAEHHKVQL
jgi:conjugal transfer pilus assembly protein TraB